MRRTKSTYLALVTVLLSPIAANAVPIVITESCADDANLTCAIGIDGLEIDGAFYNVDFILGSYNDAHSDDQPLFLGDVFGASSAGSSIVSILNTHGGIFGVNGIGNSTSFFSSIVHVPFRLNNTTFGDTVSSSCFYNSNGNPTWTSGCSSGRGLDFTSTGPSVYESFAVFRAAQVPEPGTLALFGIGLAALGLTRRRRQI